MSHKNMMARGLILYAAFVFVLLAGTSCIRQESQEHTDNPKKTDITGENKVFDRIAAPEQSGEDKRTETATFAMG